MSSDEARDLIDLVADAMDDQETPREQYLAAQAIIIAYHRMHPNSVFAVRQSGLYVTRRLGVELPNVV